MIRVPAKTALAGRAIAGATERPDRRPGQARCPGHARHPGQTRLTGQAWLIGQLGHLCGRAVLPHEAQAGGVGQTAGAATILKCG